MAEHSHGAQQVALQVSAVTFSLTSGTVGHSARNQEQRQTWGDGSCYGDRQQH